MHIYAFGSICRGDVTPESDVDLLAVTEGMDARFDASAYSIYSYKRLRHLWEEGNPFAWHLFLESRLLFSDDQSDFVRALGRPRPYLAAVSDCDKFSVLFASARASLLAETNSPTFELSTIFLAVRNFATCFSLGVTMKPDFSRRSALQLGPHSLDIGPNEFSILERARIMSTRGIGVSVDRNELAVVGNSLNTIEQWMSDLSVVVRNHA